MKAGQKVLYNEGTYVVAADSNGVYDIVTEEYIAMYNIAGVNVRGSGLSTFDAPDGMSMIVNLEGTPVGFSNIKESDLTVLDGQVIDLATFHDDTSAFA